MTKFDTKVQYIKNEVMREVARYEFRGALLDNIFDIPKKIVLDNTPSIRCCVYKERAIVAERVKAIMWKGRDNQKYIDVIDLACDECPEEGYEVTTACRGCIAHRCAEACKFNAITFEHQHEACIDKTKCVECGQCSKVCPYSAIVNRKRPCQNACKINAISIDDEKVAKVDSSKCIVCGACVYQCPFGAIVYKSNVLQVIDLLKKSKHGYAYQVCAIVAPAIASQFVYGHYEQVIAGLKFLGFHVVVETALGADKTAWLEAEELKEKGFVISSCCPSFVSLVREEFPDLGQYLSKTLSPMNMIAQSIKDKQPNTKIIFIGPCIGKKMEVEKNPDLSYVDSVLTFEELQALFDSCDIDITKLPRESLDDASCYGRSFARSGGLTDAIQKVLEEQKISNLQLKPCVCDGIEACRVALQKKRNGKLQENFIEGMACVGGCIGGAGCLTHSARDKHRIEEYSNGATKKNIL